MNILCIFLLALVGLTSANVSVTLAHLKDREGYATIGYVPTSGSGCTIGIGIDLGQQTKAGLQSKGISATIITKVEKYLGKTTLAALTAASLKCSDLVLTTAEADSLSTVFMMESYNIAQPYSLKMTDKGLAALVSLRHWAGSLGCTNCKLSATVNGVDVNFLWNAIQGKTATTTQVKDALVKLLPYKTVGTAAYNRINHEITYLSTP